MNPCPYISVCHVALNCPEEYRFCPTYLSYITNTLELENTEEGKLVKIIKPENNVFLVGGEVK